MYIMDLAIFGFKLNLEVLILIGIVYLILCVNTLAGCCNVRGIAEGYENGGAYDGTDVIVKEVAKQVKQGVDAISY